MSNKKSANEYIEKEQKPKGDSTVLSGVSKYKGKRLVGMFDMNKILNGRDLDDLSSDELKNIIQPMLDEVNTNIAAVTKK